VELIAPRRGGTHHAQKWLSPGPKLSDAQKEDVAFGLRSPRRFPGWNRQSVVVKNGTVLAVEGLRHGQVPRARRRTGGKVGGAIAVKVAKVGHDMRFDIPLLRRQDP